MEFDTSSLNEMTPKELRKVIIANTKFALVMGLIFLLGGAIPLALLILAYVFVPALVPKWRKPMAAHLLVNKAIFKALRQKNRPSLEDIKKFKTTYDPFYVKTLKAYDEHNRKESLNLSIVKAKREMRDIEEEIDVLEQEKEQTIVRLEQERWTVISPKKFTWSSYYQVAVVNGENYSIFDVSEPELIMRETSRSVAVQSETTHKNLSLGGAVAGAVVGGGIGAVVGASTLGKKTGQTTITTTTIPQYSYIGIRVRLKNHYETIVLLNTPTDADSIKGKVVYNTTDKIMNTIKSFPYMEKKEEAFVPVRELPEVVQIDEQIEVQNNLLREATTKYQQLVDQKLLEAPKKK